MKCIPVCATLDKECAHPGKHCYFSCYTEKSNTQETGKGVLSLYSAQTFEGHNNLHAVLNTFVIWGVNNVND